MTLYGARVFHVKSPHAMQTVCRDTIHEFELGLLISWGMVITILLLIIVLKFTL